MAVDRRQIFLVAIEVDSNLFRLIGCANFNESVGFLSERETGTLSSRRAAEGAEEEGVFFVKTDVGASVHQKPDRENFFLRDLCSPL
jgi:hypothetical protein